MISRRRGRVILSPLPRELVTVGLPDLGHEIVVEPVGLQDVVAIQENAGTVKTGHPTGGIEGTTDAKGPLTEGTETGLPTVLTVRSHPGDGLWKVPQHPYQMIRREVFQINKKWNYSFNRMFAKYSFNLI